VITAKNYAAQAIADLTDRTTVLNDSNEKRLAMSFYTDKIKDSVKFAIPDNGRIFDDELKGVNFTSIRLPYPITVVECFQKTDKIEYRELYNHGIVSFKRLILAFEWVDENEDIFFTIVPFTGFNRLESKEKWSTSPVVFTAPCQNNENVCYIEKFSDQFYDIFLEEQGKISLDQSINDIYEDVRIFMELIEALSCKNVEQSVIQQASPKNAQRIKSHKLPIYETKFLTIKATRSKTEKNKIGIAGSHATPRQHLRRGHIRRLESGNIWVNSCVVGDSEKGVIKKDYRVEA
jgi:hypothetical protein